MSEFYGSEQDDCTPADPRTTWVELGYERYACVNASGRIVGEVVGVYRAYTAHLNDISGNKEVIKSLGTYVKREDAKNAVDNVIALRINRPPRITWGMH